MMILEFQISILKRWEIAVMTNTEPKENPPIPELPPITSDEAPKEQD